MFNAAHTSLDSPAPTVTPATVASAAHTSRRVRGSRGAARLAAGAVVLAGVVIAPAAADTVLADDPGVDCAEWDADRFDAWVDRLNPYMVRINMTYDDSDEPFDVCPYSVSFQLFDGDDDLVWSGGTNASSIATTTESIVGVERHLMPHEGCEWEVHLTIEESLPIVLDSTDLCLDLGFALEPIAPIEPVFPWSPPVLRLAPLATWFAR